MLKLSDALAVLSIVGDAAFDANVIRCTGGFV